MTRKDISDLRDSCRDNISFPWQENAPRMPRSLTESARSEKSAPHFPGLPRGALIIVIIGTVIFRGTQKFSREASFLSFPDEIMKRSHVGNCRPKISKVDQVLLRTKTHKNDIPAAQIFSAYKIAFSDML